ncbi:MAG: hypothetical protein WDZ52_14435, partial [Pseudohongiellaceae bacterium]
NRLTLPACSDSFMDWKILSYIEKRLSGDTLVVESLSFLDADLGTGQLVFIAFFMRYQRQLMSGIVASGVVENFYVGWSISLQSPMVSVTAVPTRTSST